MHGTSQGRDIHDTPTLDHVLVAGWAQNGVGGGSDGGCMYEGYCGEVVGWRTTLRDRVIGWGWRRRSGWVTEGSRRNILVSSFVRFPFAVDALLFFVSVLRLLLIRSLRSPLHSRVRRRRRSVLAV